MKIHVNAARDNTRAGLIKFIEQPTFDLFVMSRELYRRFTSLCQKWPKDETKSGRDYGEFFRKQLGAYFPQGELSQVKDVDLVDSQLSALERIANNSYYNENPLKKSSASGLESWACREAVSNEGIRTIQEQEEATLISKLKTNLRFKFSRDEPNESSQNNKDNS